MMHLLRLSSHLLPTTRRTSSILVSRNLASGLRSTMATSTLPHSSTMRVIETLDELRAWRDDAFRSGKSVGFIPTMGALHDGHLSLVRRSLEDNDLTVVSIFVNPAQFAPHEDFASYPRTLPQDLDMLSGLESSPPARRSTSVVFVPSLDVMYPPIPRSSSSSSYSPLTSETGTFVEVKGLSSVLEGRSRPTFFRGVSTVVTKFFNAILPTRAYFGQKDIQQALILRRMVRDLLMRYPTPETLHVVPTVRGHPDGEEENEDLALSSRNTYMSRSERAHAPCLYRALRRGKQLWDSGATKEACVRGAIDVLEMEELAATEDGVRMRIDYVEMNDPWTLDPISGGETRKPSSTSSEEKEVDGQPVILSGAIWVGQTRLLDNVILGDSSKIIY